MENRKKEPLGGNQLNNVCGGLEPDSINTPISMPGEPQTNHGVSPAEAMANVFSRLGSSLGQEMETAAEVQSYATLNSTRQPGR